MKEKGGSTMASAALPEAPGLKKKSSFKYAFTSAILASMATIVLGYDIGVMSGASLYIKKDLKITDVQLEILMGILSLYALIGSFAAARTSDWIGRRVTVVFAAAIFFTGSLLMGFAANYAMLMVGRFVTGIGVGYAIMVGPVYTVEVSPASSRGFLTSFTEVFINFGILLGYVSNYAFARLPLHLGWRVMLGIGAIPSALLALMVFGMPESPRWLVMKGRLADARAVLEKTSDTPEEASERLADIKAAAGIPKDLDGDVVTVPKKCSGEEKQVWKELLLSHPSHAAHTARGARHPFLPAGDGLRLRRALQPTRVQERRHHRRQPPPRRHLRRRRHQDALHTGGHLLPRPRRPAAAAYQHGRHARLPHRPCDGPHRRGPPPGRQDPVGHRAVHRDHPCLRVVLLHRPRPHHGRVHRRGVPAAGARAGLRGRRGVQPRDQRPGLHDIPVAVQGHHHRRRLLPVRRRRRARAGVLLHLHPGDARADAGGHRQALRHDGHGRGSRGHCLQEREGGSGDDEVAEEQGTWQYSLPDEE